MRDRMRDSNSIIPQHLRQIHGKSHLMVGSAKKIAESVERSFDLADKALRFDVVSPRRFYSYLIKEKKRRVAIERASAGFVPFIEISEVHVIFKEKI